MEGPVPASSKRKYVWVAYLVLGLVILYSGKVIWWKLDMDSEPSPAFVRKAPARKSVVGFRQIPKTTSNYKEEAFVGTWYSDRNKQRIRLFPNHIFMTGTSRGQWYLDGMEIVWRYSNVNSNQDLDRNLISYLREDTFVLKEKNSSQTVFTRISDIEAKSDWQKEWDEIRRDSSIAERSDPVSEKPSAVEQPLDWRQRWENLEKTPPPYKNGTFFMLSEYEYCPKTRNKYEYRKTYRLIEAETGLFGIERINLTTSLVDMPLEWNLKYHVPSYEIDKSENADHPLKNVQIPAGLFQVINGPTHFCRVSHRREDSHYAATQEWYAPNIPFPILRWSCEGPSCDVHKPPLSEDQLPTDSYYEWSILKSVKMN